MRPDAPCAFGGMIVRAAGRLHHLSPTHLGAALEQERWRNGYRGRVVCHILSARGARRQSPPDGLLRHIFAVAGYHSGAGVAPADFDRAVTRRAGPLPAEQLSAVAAEAAVARSRRDRHPAEA